MKKLVMKSDNESIIPIDEDSLISVLGYACDGAELNERTGYIELAELTRTLVRNLVFKINHHLGYEKYYYDRKMGVRSVELDKEICDENR